jgi:transcriptional regulator with XRE-family HTH domain
MSEPAADLPELPLPEHDEPHLDLPAIARNLRAEGMTRSQIARSLGVSTWRVTELLAGEPARHPGLRARAQDDLHARARELRAAGKTYDEIAEGLGVSKSSVSLWTRDLPKPPPRQPGTYEFERIAAARRAQWDERLAEREDERRAVKAVATEDVGALSERELLLIGTALYWAEGAKDKPYDRREALTLINSDPDVIRLHLRWLRLLSFSTDDCSFALSIHESADPDAATAYWRDVVGPGGRWRKPSLKRHNPSTVRKNVGEQYHGCLVVYARQSRSAYQRMEGYWRGIVDALSGVV